MSKSITILGAGISGTGAAMLAATKGYDVFVSDLGEISAITRSLFEDAGIKYEDGGHSEEEILNSDFIIKSPGIPFSAPIVEKAISANIPVIDELEFAGQFLDKPTILVTGTNGKTTTTLLIEHILRTCGIKAKAVGNVGNSLAQALLEDTNIEIYVIEASSFQLDGMSDFRSDVSVLLNITPDHLNVYPDMSAYANSKLRIKNLIKENGWFVYNADDKQISSSNGYKEALGVSLRDNKSEIFLAGELIQFNTPSGPASLTIDSVGLKGEHNLFNSMAAVGASLRFTKDMDKIEEALGSFNAAPHRLEWITKIKDIDFVNDSKATNLDATQYALDSFDSLIWIAGGIDKGNNYDQVQSIVDEKVRSLVCLGLDNSNLLDAFENTVNSITETSSMQDAVDAAWKKAVPSDVVLLSPACASFDLFKSYEDRGDQFREAVMNLKERIERRDENA